MKAKVQGAADHLRARLIVIVRMMMMILMAWKCARVARMTMTVAGSPAAAAATAAVSTASG